MRIASIASKLALVLAAGVWAAAAPQAGAGMMAGATAHSAVTGPAAPGGVSLAEGTAMNAELKSKLDAGKAKPGDQITAVTTADVKQNGRVVIPKGSTLNGHVTQVTASDKDHAASSVGVVFDQAVTRRGTVIPLRAGITGITTAGAATAAGPSGWDDMPMGGGMAMGGGGRVSGGGGLLAGGGGGLAGGLGVAGAVTGSVAPVAGPAINAGGAVDGGLRASNGLPLRIQSPVSGSAAAAAGASEGTVLTTPKGNLRLSSGTRVQLRIEAAAHGGV